MPLLFSEANRERNRESAKKIVLNYHYSIKRLRREIEAAYLALYDNGRSLRVVPVGSELALGGPETALSDASGIQPWGTMQMLLYGGDSFVRRFFDPRFQPESDSTPTASLPDGDDDGIDGSADDSVGDNVLNAEPDDEQKRLERELFSGEPQVDLRTVSRSSAIQPNLGPVGRVRVLFQSLIASYSTLTQEYAYARFSSVASDLQAALRDAAGRSSALRLGFVEEEQAAAGTHTEEYLAKTAYPEENTLHAEYRYYRLAPFFWMWVFAAAAAVFAGASLVTGVRRRTETDSSRFKETGNENRLEEYLLWGGVALLCLSIAVTFLGGALRAWISGWAPVTNMYETIVLMAFSASLFGLWYALYPLINPPLQMAWRYSSFPILSTALRHLIKFLTTRRQVPSTAQTGETDGEQAMRQAAEDFGLPGGVPLGITPEADTAASSQRLSEAKAGQAAAQTTAWQTFLCVPRIILMLVTFLLVVNISYGEYAHEHGIFAAAVQMLKMSDFLDWIVVAASIALIVWFAPHLVLTAFLFPVILARPNRIAAELGIVSFVERPVVGSAHARSEMSSVMSGESAGFAGRVDVSGRCWLAFARNQIMDRTLFILISAAVTLMAGLVAHFNSAQFNPDIRPIVAVLRSNFWLTVHVIAIVVGYAAAIVAWGMAVVALGDAIFGRYRHSELLGGRTCVQLPPLNEMVAPIIHKLLQAAVLLLILGTVLGARWADYSWGRFWSWDPKEVWALITILFYVVVLHGRIARFYGQIGVMVGALFGSIAVIFTWYGINFMFKGSVHSYGSGSSGNATLFMVVFMALNILWGCLALFRYNAVMFGQESGEEYEA